MTTIAFRDNVLAADSLAWEGDTCIGHVEKAGRMADGSLWALCGVYQYFGAAKRWLACPLGDPPEWPVGGDGAILIVVTSQGHVMQWEGGGWVEINAPFHAWGSGSEVALGAMAANATAEQAVAIASDFDAYTGGPVKRFALGPCAPVAEHLGPEEEAQAWANGGFTAFEPDVPEDPKKAYRERMGL